MSNSRWPAFGLLALLYVLHNDWWLWSNRSLVVGLPAGLAYHVLYMIVTAGALAFLVRSAWPTHLDAEDDQ